MTEEESENPRVVHIDHESFETLINEEALLFAKFLRNERKIWSPRMFEMDSKSGHTSRNVTLVLVLLATVVFVFVAPVFPVTYQESYTTIEDKQRTIGQLSTANTILSGGYFLTWHFDIQRGRDEEFSVSANDTVNLYISTKTQYDLWRAGMVSFPEKQLIGLSSGKLGYHVPTSDTYYFVIENPYSDSLNIAKKNVMIYSATIVEYWQEEVTKYRTVTTRVTLWDLITGTYRKQ